MFVYVTQQDIDAAVALFRSAPDNFIPAYNCPIACALRRMFPGQNVRVQARTVRLGQFLFALPQSAQNFIVDFDSQQTGAAPFSFRIGEARYAD